MGVTLHSILQYLSLYSQMSQERQHTFLSSSAVHKLEVLFYCIFYYTTLPFSCQEHIFECVRVMFDILPTCFPNEWKPVLCRKVESLRCGCPLHSVPPHSRPTLLAKFKLWGGNEIVPSAEKGIPLRLIGQTACRLNDKPIYNSRYHF